MTRKTRDRLVYWIVWGLCFLPIPLVVWWIVQGELTADPIKEGIHYLGRWGLRLLCVGLAITPLRQLLGWTWLLRFRRTIGVFAFAYIALHLLAYAWPDLGFDWEAIGKDIVKRPYITFGMASFVLLLGLAVTSTNGMIRRLGARRWRNLHRLVYVAAPLGVLHYDLLVKRDASWPHFYAVILALLLGYRAVVWARKRFLRPQPRQPAVAA